MEDPLIRAGCIFAGYAGFSIPGGAPVEARQKQNEYRAEKDFVPHLKSRRKPRLNGTMQLSIPRSAPRPVTLLAQTLEKLIAGARMNRRAFVSLLTVLFCTLPSFPQGPPAKQPPPEEAPAKQTVYDFSLVDMDGKVVPLSTYEGKVLLIVNLASQSIYNTQIAALNDLQKTYGPKGLQVIGVPSGDFGGEELKDPAAIKKYYTDTAKVDFPVFAEATITGINAIPLYQFLCDPKQSVPGGPLNWSYTKFLIDRKGHPLARYEVDVDPANIDFHVTIEDALAGKFKKEGGGGRPAGRRGGGAN